MEVSELRTSKFALHFTALSGRLKWQKNIQSISKLLLERPRPGLQNEPQLDSLDPQSLNPLMASLWIGSGEELAIKDFGDGSSRLSNGSFRSSGRSRYGPDECDILYGLVGNYLND